MPAKANPAGLEAAKIPKRCHPEEPEAILREAKDGSHHYYLSASVNFTLRVDL